MSTLLKRTLAGLFVVFVSASLAFGAAEAATSSSNLFCGDDPGEIGTCPPYNEDTCLDDCVEMFQSPDADCLPTTWDGPCCTCPV